MSSELVDGDKVLHARTVLITGANRGLGLEIVRQLLRLPQPPSALICTCRQLSKSEELQALARTNPAVKVIEFDVSHFHRVLELAEEVKSIVGDQGLNLLVNNAGISTRRPKGGMDVTSVEDFIEHLNVNTVGPFALVKGLLPLLKLAASRRPDKGMDINEAAIVNISSKMGSIGSVVQGISTPVYAYRTSKAGLTMMTKLMALDFEQFGIMAVAVHPGSVQTDMGGPAALLKVEEGVSKTLHVLANITERHSGLHVSFDGSILPW